MARDDIYTATLMYTVLRCVGRVWNATDRLKSPTADGARFRLIGLRRRSMLMICPLTQCVTHHPQPSRPNGT